MPSLDPAREARLCEGLGPPARPPRRALDLEVPDLWSLLLWMGPPSEGAGRQIAFTLAPPSRYERIDLPGFPAEAEKAVQETND